MINKAIYITHAKRTANGSLLGSLSQIPASRLGAIVIKSILNESKIEPNIVDEIILGQVITGGVGQNAARQALIYAELPKEIPAFTINKVCGSGLKSVILASQTIALGINNIVIAGGQENMSLGMHGAYIRTGQKFGNMQMLDLMQYDGLTDAFSGLPMGITAEKISEIYSISRIQQDEFALRSHIKAAAARESGRFKEEIVPIEISIKKQKAYFDYDEGIRSDTNLELLSKLKPVFEPVNGSVTAGNSSTINDGAACLLLASEEAIKNYRLTPLVKIISYASAGVDPSIMGTGPVPASIKALKIAGWDPQDLDLIELNEAFAAQAIYVNRQMKWDPSKVNVNGGAIALGHPIGASGARILVTLIHQMQRQKAKKALVTMCIGGGMGIAMCVEAV